MGSACGRGLFKGAGRGHAGSAWLSSDSGRNGCSLGQYPVEKKKILFWIIPQRPVRYWTGIQSMGFMTAPEWERSMKKRESGLPVCITIIRETFLL